MIIILSLSGYDKIVKLLSWKKQMMQEVEADYRNSVVEELAHQVTFILLSVVYIILKFYLNYNMDWYLSDTCFNQFYTF